MQTQSETSLTADSQLELVTVAGPTEVKVRLFPPGPYMIGRRSDHPIALVGDNHVSRDHASLKWVTTTSTRTRTTTGHGQWSVTDAGSRHGTYVNGVRLSANRACPLEPGDMLTIAPWTLQIIDRAAVRPSSTGLRVTTRDDQDLAAGRVKPLRREGGPSLSQRRLTLLLDCAAALQEAGSEEKLAEAVLDAALAGTLFKNAAFLRPAGPDASVEVLTHRGDIVGGRGSVPRLSRSLIIKAASGEAARLESEGTANYGQSIVDFRIGEAICAPLMIGAGAAGYLYLDNKGATGGGSAPDADEFIVGLARLAALSLANLKRLDLERRHARIEAEIAAAAEAQQWILPPREGVIGPLTYRGESKPGRDLCGDFFDVISLDEPRTVVALGDVSGKGAAAGVLMTASQGFLHAALRQHGDPARAVADLSTFLRARMPENKFVTLWLGVFDTSKGELSYVDAGHSHAAMIRADGAVERLNQGDGTLVGIFDNARYTVVKTKFGRGDRALIVSDGLVEQPTATQDEEGRHEQFGIERVIECFRSAVGDAVNSLFQAVEAHAGTKRLNDDATAVILRW